jgi:hypothetical protein
MRSGSVVGGAVLAAFVAALGCSEEAGLLIEVTRDDTVPASLGRLELHVGVAGLGGDAARYVDPAPEADVRLEGRDLGADPFRLFLRPRDYPDAEVMVAVVAYQGGEVAGFGALEGPVGFVDGKVARWRIVLSGGLPDGLESTDTGCLRWIDGDGERMVIGDPGDRDCDGWRADDDCDDLDPLVNPGAAEICDGADNDCNLVCDDTAAGLDLDGDGFTECGSIADHCGLSDAYLDCEPEVGEIGPAKAELCDGLDDDCDGDLLQRGPCFAIDENSGGCFFGERDCAEQPEQPTTWDGPCRPLLDPVLHVAPDALCPAYDECDALVDPDPYRCAIESKAAGLLVEPCRAAFQVATGDQCGGQEVVLPTEGLEICSWAIIGGTEQADYLVGLRPADLPDETPQPSVSVCNAVLVVTAREPGPLAPHVFLLARTDELLQISFGAIAVEGQATDDCDADRGLACQNLPSP